MRTRAILTVLFAFSSACTGRVADLAERPGDDEYEDPTIPQPLPRALVLVSPRQYANAATELLGLPAGSVTAPRTGGADIGALHPGGTDRMTNPLGTEIRDIAESAAAAGAAAYQSPRCGGDELACAEAIFAPIARRAFRREPTADDLAGLREVFMEGRADEGSFAGGMRWTFEAILQAPSFLYRREFGREIASRRYQLDAYETATALAFFLRDSGPDDALLDAAARGDLDDEEGLEREVDRMLAEPAVRARVTELVLRWIGLNRLEGTARNDAAFTAELRASMRGETERFVDDVLWRRTGTLAELLTSRSTFVDARLAAHYGVAAPGGDGFAPIDLPAGERAGLLTQASWLTTNAELNESSVVYRGLFTLQQMLCMPIRPPEAGLIESARADLEALHSERDRANYRAMRTRCSGCHTYFDPLGLAYEKYDLLGRYRASYDGTSLIRAPQSIAGEVDGAVALVERIAQSPDALSCAAQRIASTLAGRHLTPTEALNLAPVIEQARSGDGNMVELVRAIALWPGLRIRRAQ